MAYRIKIEPQGKTLTTNGKETIKAALEREGFYFPVNCGGAGICSNCRIEFLTEPPKMKRVESSMFGRNSTYRMACQHPAHEDCSIALPITTETMNVKRVSGMDIAVKSKGFGIAIDLGTTTIAIYLVNLKTGKIVDQKSFINPQTTIGGDVMTRLKKTMEEGGLEQLNYMIHAEIGKSVISLLALNKLHADAVKEVAIAGNSVMAHLFLKKDPSGLAQKPFISSLQEKGWLNFDPASISMPSTCKCRFFPVLQGFIGGDTVAAILAIDLDQKKGINILVDLGTNGEIVLSVNGQFYATSAAAGPAFDGMSMYSGMPAISGAIEDVSRNGNVFIINNSEPLGICGSGYISLIAYMFHNQIINETGLIDPGKVKRNYWLPISEKDNIRITQEDIRKFQLAKGAIAAGIKILCDHASVSYDQIDRLYITGSFGTHISVKSAIIIGLIPAISENKIEFIDNGAGRGAIISLANPEFRDRV
ncbi:MAG: ASKHA domain-containing protein, partial [Calditrichaceae bacterium]